MDQPPLDFTITSFGNATVINPLLLSNEDGDFKANYVSDDSRIMYRIEVPAGETRLEIVPEELMERAGPREKIFFDPAKVHAAVVTCGGLCPGINDVIYSIVMTLWHDYGVRRICGIRYGYRGFLSDYAIPEIDLNPDAVEGIHQLGGTILGSSRGAGNRVSDIVDSLDRMNVNMLFTIGGDGTMKGADAIAQEALKRNLKIAVVGIPKTIDNDISFTERTFGFETAMEHASEAVAAAHVEAHDAVNGIGLVKVMGRDSGFIAAHTALASSDVNFVMVPEVPFALKGENGFLMHLEKRLERRHHAVVLVAEGAGQNLVPAEGTDASGNKKLGDIGLFLKKEISAYFKAKGIEANLKYIDPSYMIRSAPANANDSLFCQRLGGNAVHAAMAGRTGMQVSQFNSHLVHIPIRMAVSRRKKLDPDGSLWRDVINSTGQPALME